MKVYRLICIEGTDDWVSATLNNSYVQPGRPVELVGSLPIGKITELARLPEGSETAELLLEVLCK